MAGYSPSPHSIVIIEENDNASNQSISHDNNELDYNECKKNIKEDGSIETSKAEQNHLPVMRRLQADKNHLVVSNGTDQCDNKASRMERIARRVSFVNFAIQSSKPPASREVTTKITTETTSTTATTQNRSTIGNVAQRKQGIVNASSSYKPRLNIQERLSARLNPNNPLLSTKMKTTGFTNRTNSLESRKDNTRGKELWALVRDKFLKDPSKKPMSIIEVIRLARSFEKAKLGIRRKESHVRHQRDNLTDKKDKRKIGALLIASVIEAEMPHEFLETLCKSGQLQRMIRSFACGSLHSKQLLTELCLEYGDDE